MNIRENWVNEDGHGDEYFGLKPGTMKALDKIKIFTDLQKVALKETMSYQSKLEDESILGRLRRAFGNGGYPVGLKSRKNQFHKITAFKKEEQRIARDKGLLEDNNLPKLTPEMARLLAELGVDYIMS